MDVPVSDTDALIRHADTVIAQAREIGGQTLRLVEECRVSRSAFHDADDEHPEAHSWLVGRLSRILFRPSE